jgi:hypothetical protein
VTAIVAVAIAAGALVAGVFGQPISASRLTRVKSWLTIEGMNLRNTHEESSGAFLLVTLLLAALVAAIPLVGMATTSRARKELR